MFGVENFMNFVSLRTAAKFSKETTKFYPWKPFLNRNHQKNIHPKNFFLYGTCINFNLYRIGILTAASFSAFSASNFFLSSSALLRSSSTLFASSSAWRIFSSISLVSSSFLRRAGLIKWLQSYMYIQSLLCCRIVHVHSGVAPSIASTPLGAAIQELDGSYC